MMELGTVAVTVFQPYKAWRWFAADDVAEVSEEYVRIVDAWEEQGSWMHPELANEVTVVGAEYRNGAPLVWYIEDGRLDCRDAWQIRRVPW